MRVVLVNVCDTSNADVLSMFQKLPLDQASSSFCLSFCLSFFLSFFFSFFLSFFLSVFLSFFLSFFLLLLLISQYKCFDGFADLAECVL